jgi:hypothetical protein
MGMGISGNGDIIEKNKKTEAPSAPSSSQEARSQEARAMTSWPISALASCGVWGICDLRCAPHGMWLELEITSASAEDHGGASVLLFNTHRPMTCCELHSYTSHDTSTTDYCP